MERNSLKLLEKIDATRLPPLPQVLLRLVELCDDDDAELSQLSSTIAGDSGLATRILGVAGSAAYRTAVQINTLDRALALIGTDMVKTLAISAAVHQVFSGISPTGLDRKHFWRHSLLTAQLCRRLAGRMGEPHPGEAYLAGLIHDIGQMLLAANFPEDYAPLLDAWLDGEQLSSAEQEALGVSHAEVGAWLIRSWNLDGFLADAVAYHHEPVLQLPGAHPLVQIVHLANRLAQENVAEKLPNTFGLNEKELMEMRGKASLEVLQIARALGIDIEPEGESGTQHALSGTPSLPGERRRNRPAPREGSPAETGSIVRERRTNRSTYSPIAIPEGEEEEAILKLANKIREQAEITGVRQCLVGVRNRDEAMTAIRQCLHLLFGAENVHFYLLDDSGEKLRNMGVGADDPIRFAVPVDVTTSALVKSYKTNTLLALDRSDVASVADKQTLQLLSHEAMLCLPLNTGEKKLGVIAIGGGVQLIERLQERREVLLLFAREAAQALAMPFGEAKTPSADSSEHLLRARKVVHEVNNPLTIMKNYLNMLGTKLPSDSPARQDLQIIDQEIDRVSAIVRRLVHQDEAEISGLVDLDATLTDLLKLLGPSLFKDSGIEVRTRLSEMPAMRTDARKLRQVLMNLIRNAAEAMPHGGRLTVSIKDRVVVDDKTYVQISIEDTGPGLPPELMDKLFKPVKTTKGEGHAGLGLSIVSSLVKELRGSARCETGKQGTKFEILLPREDDRS
jgi:putative nucleotidyltransferase with HDIG domain